MIINKLSYYHYRYDTITLLNAEMAKSCNAYAAIRPYIKDNCSP